LLLTNLDFLRNYSFLALREILVTDLNESITKSHALLKWSVAGHRAYVKDPRRTVALYRLFVKDAIAAPSNIFPNALSEPRTKFINEGVRRNGGASDLNC
jgi:hypothetical protein